MNQKAERGQEEPGRGAGPPQRQEGIDYGRLLRATPVVILVVLFILFTIQNAEPVELEFLGWTFETRRIILLIGTALFGILVWELGRFIFRWRRDRSGKTST